MKNLIICLLLFSQSAWSARTFGERELLLWSKGNVPRMDEIRNIMLNSQISRNELEEEYAPEIFGQASYAETNERPIIQFLPVFSPAKTAQLGVRKKLSHGFQTQLAATTDQRSAASSVSGNYDNVTTTVLSFTVQMDLWKDLFGRISKAERKNAHLEFQKAELEKDIRSKVFEISLRRIYWNLVAIEEQLKIAGRLQVTSTQQLQDAKKRLQNSIGDAGEVYRYEAQVASRNAQVTFLKYQRENLFKQLRNLLPEIGSEELVLSHYDIDQTISEVVDCSMVIMRERAVPYQFTKYDEVVKILKEVKKNQKEINQRYSDVDINLFGTVKSTGIGSEAINATDYKGSYEDAYKDMKNNNRAGYEAGIKFDIPLGNAKEKTQETKTLYDESRLRVMMDQSEAQLVSTHTQMAKTMPLIQEVITTERIGSAALRKRLNVIRQKYSQARVTVNDLILDQDALLNSEFTTVDAELQAVNTVLDYLAVFTDTPCAFNRN